jgi:lipopolysaccharide export system protein LptA
LLNSVRSLVLILVALAAVAAFSAEHSMEDLLRAQQDRPIKINADSSDFNYTSGRLIFRGLKLTQGDLTIRAELAETANLDFADGAWTFTGAVEVEAQNAKLFCDEARIDFRNHQLARAELLGEPARFEQLVVETGKTNEGEAERMLYTLDNGMLELTRNARFSDGTNEIKGDNITYDVVGRNLTAGSGDSGPVTILIEPPVPSETETTP